MNSSHNFSEVNLLDKLVVTIYNGANIEVSIFSLYGIIEGGLVKKRVETYNRIFSFDMGADSMLMLIAVRGGHFLNHEIIINI